MGLLEMFDNPNLIQSLIGGGFSMNGPTQMPDMEPPASMSPPGSEMLAQAGPRFGGDMSPEAAWGPPAQGGLGGTLGGSAVPTPMPRPAGVDAMEPAGPQMQPAPMPEPRPMGIDAMGPAGPQMAQAPMPAPRPAGITVASPAAPPPQAPGAPRRLTPDSPVQDIVHSYRAAGGGTDVSASVPGQGLANTLGMTPERIQQFTASLGAGLKAAGNSAGKSPGQAFASGMGAGLEGGAQETERQRKRKMEESDQKFRQSSTAFKDMIAAQQQDNMAEYRKNQAKYLSARADALASGAAGGSKASNAWQNTPYGKVIQAEQRIQAFMESQRKIATEQSKQSGDPLDEAGIVAKTDAFRQNLYKQIGIDPGQGAKIKDLGTQPPKLPDGKPNPAFNPFDNLTREQVETLPDGAWFRHEGKVYRRDYKKRPPAKPSAQAEAPNLDDQEAMSG